MGVDKATYVKKDQQVCQFSVLSKKGVFSLIMTVSYGIIPHILSHTYPELYVLL